MDTSHLQTSTVHQVHVPAPAPSLDDYVLWLDIAVDDGWAKAPKVLQGSQQLARNAHHLTLFSVLARLHEVGQGPALRRLLRTGVFGRIDALAAKAW